MDQAVLPVIDMPPGLLKESRGKEAFRSMIRAWMIAGDWSLANLSALSEEAFIAMDLKGLQRLEGCTLPVDEGTTLVHSGHAWRALVKADEEPSDDSRQWKRLGRTRLLHTSGLNQLLRGMTQVVHSGTFENLGRVNLWLEQIRSGEMPKPSDPRLAELCQRGVVIQDAQGVFGPEEFLSVALGRLDSPLNVNVISEREARAESEAVGRKVRSLMAAAGLDLVDDWPQVLALYPSTAQAKQRQLKLVVTGAGAWSPEQAVAERMAVELLINRLETAADAAREARPRRAVGKAHN